MTDITMSFFINVILRLYVEVITIIQNNVILHAVTDAMSFYM